MAKFVGRLGTTNMKYRFMLSDIEFKMPKKPLVGKSLVVKWIRGPKTAPSNPAIMNNNVCNWNGQPLAVICTMYKRKTGNFQSKGSKVKIYSGSKCVAESAMDLKDHTTMEETKKQITLKLRRCADKKATLTATLSVRWMKELGDVADDTASVMEGHNPDDASVFSMMGGSNLDDLAGFEDDLAPESGGKSKVILQLHEKIKLLEAQIANGGGQAPAMDNSTELKTLESKNKGLESKVKELTDKVAEETKETKRATVQLKEKEVLLEQLKTLNTAQREKEIASLTAEHKVSLERAIQDGKSNIALLEEELKTLRDTESKASQTAAASSSAVDTLKAEKIQLQEELEQAARDKEAATTDLKTTVTDLTERNTHATEELQADIDRYKRRFEDVQSQLKKSQDRAEQSESKARELSAQAVLNAQGDGSLRTSLREVEQELTELKQDKASQDKKAEEVLEALQDKYNQAVSQSDVYQDEIQGLTRAATEAKERNEGLQSSLSSLRSQTQSLTAERDSLQSQLAKAGRHATQEEEKLTEATALASSLQKHLTSITTDHADLKEQKLHLEEDLATIRTQAATKESSLSTQLEELTHQLHAAETAKDQQEEKLLDELADMKVELTTAKGHIATLRDAAEDTESETKTKLDSLLSQVRDTQHHADSLAHELASEKTSGANQIAALREDLRQHEEKEASLQSRVDRLKTQTQRLEEDAEGLRQTLLQSTASQGSTDEAITKLSEEIKSLYAEKKALARSKETALEEHKLSTEKLQRQIRETKEGSSRLQLQSQDVTCQLEAAVAENKLKDTECKSLRFEFDSVTERLAELKLAFTETSSQLEQKEKSLADIKIKYQQQGLDAAQQAEASKTKRKEERKQLLADIEELTRAHAIEQTSLQRSQRKLSELTAAFDAFKATKKVELDDLIGHLASSKQATNDSVEQAHVLEEKLERLTREKGETESQLRSATRASEQARQDAHELTAGLQKINREADRARETHASEAKAQSSQITELTDRVEALKAEKRGVQSALDDVKEQLAELKEGKEATPAEKMAQELAVLKGAFREANRERESQASSHRIAMTRKDKDYQALEKLVASLKTERTSLSDELQETKRDLTLNIRELKEVQDDNTQNAEALSEAREAIKTLKAQIRADSAQAALLEDKEAALVKQLAIKQQELEQADEDRKTLSQQLKTAEDDLLSKESLLVTLQSTERSLSEKIRTLNEEKTTVDAQLKVKVQELEEAKKAQAEAKVNAEQSAKEGKNKDGDVSSMDGGEAAKQISKLTVEKVNLKAKLDRYRQKCNALVKKASAYDEGVENLRLAKEEAQVAKHQLLDEKKQWDRVTKMKEEGFRSTQSEVKRLRTRQNKFDELKGNIFNRGKLQLAEERIKFYETELENAENDLISTQIHWGLTARQLNDEIITFQKKTHELTLELNEARLKRGKGDSQYKRMTRTLEKLAKQRDHLSVLMNRFEVDVVNKKVELAAAIKHTVDLEDQIHLLQTQIAAIRKLWASECPGNSKLKELLAASERSNPSSPRDKSRF